MSSFDLSASQETQQQQEKGEKSFLSQQERDQLKRYLSFPEEFPPEFGTWLLDYLGTAGAFQKYQVQGLPLLNTQVGDALNTLQTTVETLAAVGTTFSAQATTTNIPNGSAYNDYPPAVTVPAGTYFCIITGGMEVAFNIADLHLKMRNRQTGSEFGSEGYAIDSGPTGARQTLISIGSTTLSANGVIGMRAAAGGSGNVDFKNSALVAVRTG